jgi:hypothetical protein
MKGSTLIPHSNPETQGQQGNNRKSFLYTSILVEFTESARIEK